MCTKLHGPSMLAVKTKIYGVFYKQSSSIAFDETSSYWSALKSSIFLGFSLATSRSLVSIGQNFVTTRVVHLPIRTETSLITESDQSGPNHQLLQLCTARTTWSDSDQVVRLCIAALAGSVKISFTPERSPVYRFKLSFQGVCIWKTSSFVAF